MGDRNKSGTCRLSLRTRPLDFRQVPGLRVCRKIWTGLFHKLGKSIQDRKRGEGGQAILYGYKIANFPEIFLKLWTTPLMLSNCCQNHCHQNSLMVVIQKVVKAVSVDNQKVVPRKKGTISVTTHWQLLGCQSCHPTATLTLSRGWWCPLSVKRDWALKLSVMCDLPKRLSVKRDLKIKC